MAVSSNKYRDFLYGEEEKNTVWRFGAPPSYEVVDKLFEDGRTKVWPLGSLEEKVQNLVKTYEMEMMHKLNPADYKSMDPKRMSFSVNGRKPTNLEETGKLGGSYNFFLQTSLPAEMRGYNPAKETAETSHSIFTTVFPRGFALEILQVYSGPPVIAFKFRHWGFMEGPYKGRPPTGKMIQFFGMAVFEVDEHMKIIKVEFFMDRGELLAGILDGTGLTSSEVAAQGSKCPVMTGTG
ncbi:Pathogen-related protein [Linum grandiflorum]